MVTAEVTSWLSSAGTGSQPGSPGQGTEGRPSPSSLKRSRTVGCPDTHPSDPEKQEEGSPLTVGVAWALFS